MPAAIAPRAGLRATTAATSLVAGAFILAMKLTAWRLTGSSAVLSDALESIVNVLAALFALVSIRFAAQPADRDHPYGHGKMEQLSAAFEGGLISFAAAAIIYEGIRTLIAGPALRALDVGLAVTAAAGAANFVLGAFVLRVGTSVDSPTLRADGLHILSDVWTTVGVLVGLAAVRLTGWAVLDPIAAIGVALYLAWTGLRLVRGAAAALLDKEDPALVQTLVDALNQARVPGLIDVHRLKVLKHGNIVHVDGHIYIPEHWTVRQAHDAVQALERQLRERTGLTAELAFHLDPCHMDPCAGCNLSDCGARAGPFEGMRPITVESAAGPPR